MVVGNGSGVRVAAIGSIGIVACLLGCVPGGYEKLYDLPPSEDPCMGVNLLDGQVDGAPEFHALFTCLNNEGSLDELAPAVEELSATVNPDTGEVYLEDLVGVTNAVLADANLAHVVEIAETVVDGGQVDDVLPAAAAVIETGLVAELLPVVQVSIDSGAIATSLPPLADLLRDPHTPELVDAVRTTIDEGLAEGWISTFLPDTAAVLTVQDPNGDPALRQVLPPLSTWMTSGEAGGLVPLLDEVHDSGTLDHLIAVSRALIDQGVMQEMDTQMRPLLVHDAAGHSHMQGLLAIVEGTDGPLTCFGVTITSNLAETILDLMADRSESDIRNLVTILRSTLGLGDLFCSIPPEVDAHIDSLDALAKSGALDGLLPMLKVVKAQGQIPLVVDVLVELHGCQAFPSLEPVLVSAIDAGVMDRFLGVVPHFVDPNGEPTPLLASLLSSLDLLVSPEVAGDPLSAPAAGLLPLIGAASQGGETGLADALYLLGRTIEDPASGFDEVLPALSGALAADPDCVLLVLIADLIDDGSVERALPMVSHVIAEGHGEAMLPWTAEMIRDGTADSLLEVLAGAFDLMESSG